MKEQYMTDEAPETDTPVVAATPAEDTSQETVDFQQRYENLQPEYTRATQELAQYRQIIEALSDPERAPEALSALGYEFDQQQETPEPEQYNDPVEALKAELEQVKSQLQADKAEQAKQQYMAESLETLASEVGRDFDQDEVQLLVDLAERMPDTKGRPQVKAAFERLSGYEDKIKKTYPQTKQAARPGSGQPGAPTFDTSTEQGRLDKMAALIQASVEE